MKTHPSLNPNRPFSILAALLLAAPVLRAFGGDVQNPAIFDAAARGDTYVVLALLREHPEAVNARDARGEWGWTPLHYAVAANQTNMVELLLENQADVNARDTLGNEPLHRAALDDRWNIAVLLVAHGAAINARNDLGDTPFDYAVINGHPDLVRFLLGKGAGVEATNDLGETPLHLAAANADTEMVNLLLANKAAINAVDNKGWTPLEYIEDAETIPGEKAAATDLEYQFDQEGAWKAPNAQPAGQLTPSLTGWQREDLEQMKEQVALPTEVISFIRAKEKQAKQTAATQGLEWGPDLENFFAAAQTGRARDAETLYDLLLNDPGSPAGKGALGQMIVETVMAYESFATGDPGLVMTLAGDYMDSVPAGCI